MSFIDRSIGFTGIAVWLILQALPAQPPRINGSQHLHNKKLVAETRSNVISPSAACADVLSRTSSIGSTSPLRFEANVGQADSRIRFLSRLDKYDFLLTSEEALIQLRAPNSPTLRDAQVNSQPKSSLLRMRFVGSPGIRRVAGLDQLNANSNYFIGNNRTKWRSDVPTFSRVKCQNIYPGIDLLFYGNRGELEYDLIVAPGADPEVIKISFDGAQHVRLDNSGDLLIETPAGEIRQRKPVIYQERNGYKALISGRYVRRGDYEIAFELGAFDRSLPIVIDPTLVYSASIGGSSNESANAVAADAAGNTYITGVTTSVNFPVANAFQPNLKKGIEIGVPTEAFITKLDPSGAVVYSTYLGGELSDTAYGIAVDERGNAYVTGVALSTDFPTTALALQTRANANGRGDAFITKLNPTGNALVYSTYLGGPPDQAFGIESNVGRGIAIDSTGSAYIAGHTTSAFFPLKRPAQAVFNKGSAFGFDCLRLFPIFVLEDAFVAKLNPSGAALIYSTYLGGSGVDEAKAIAVDSAGSAYVTGTTCSIDFPLTVSSNDNNAGAFLVKLSSSGKNIIHARRIGGRGSDFGNSVAVDSEGNAYVAGQTDSDNFSTTSTAFQPRLAGSVIYATSDGGDTWRPVSGIPNSSVTALAIDPTNPLKVFAGFLVRSAADRGILVSTDGGTTWAGIVQSFPNNITWVVAIDPKNPSIVYTEHFKSTDGGITWKGMNFNSSIGPFGPARILIDPVNTSTLYLVARGGIGGDVVVPPQFFKSTDGGDNWNVIRRGTQPFLANSAVLDPKNPSTIYATLVDLYKSTDGGNTWVVPYQGQRSFSRVAIDPINTSTLYLSDHTGSLFKTIDGGATFTKLRDFGTSINDVLVDPAASEIVYAAVGSFGGSGGVFKSTDGGQTWDITDLVATPVNRLAIDPQDPSRVFAGVDFDADSFVVKLNSAGNALVYSTYLGGRSPDSANGVGVDALGNAYITGRTFSDRFPQKDALQSSKPSGLLDAATFTTRLNPTGSSITFSTYLGPSEPSFGSAIFVDPAGKTYIAGTTGTFNSVPTGVSIDSVNGGFDALVVKIVSAPKITGASVSGKNLIVFGEGFDKGAVILIDGVEQRTRNDLSKPATILIGKKSAKILIPLQDVTIRVRNADGLMSESISFVRIS